MQEEPNVRHTDRDQHVTSAVETDPDPGKSLADLAVGQSGTVICLTGGHGFLARMSALGFTPGAEVSVIRNSGQGPLIVSVLDTRIALGRGQAMRVRVRANGGSS
jgi:ferrous iron transport protein A